MSERQTADDLGVLKAREQVMFDLHDALGVPFGSDPYTTIKGLLGLREENAKLREGIKKHLHALARYGHHQYDRAASPCHYTPVKYDHAGTPQAGGNPCTCGLNEAMADFYALLSTSSEKGEQG